MTFLRPSSTEYIPPDFVPLLIPTGKSLHFFFVSISSRQPSLKPLPKYALFTHVCYIYYFECVLFCFLLPIGNFLPQSTFLILYLCLL